MNLSKEHFNNLTLSRWRDVYNKCLLGRNEKGYLTLRLLIDNIIYIQNDIKDLKYAYESEKTYSLIEHNYTTKGIEDINYKNHLLTLEFKLDNAISSLNKFTNTFEQIPYTGGKIICIIDYLIHGIRWICVEIESNTIKTRLDITNCISYIKEAEKLTGKKFRI